MDPRRGPAGLRIDEYKAAIGRLMFAWYRERGATLGSIERRLIESGVPTRTGKSSWSRSAIRGILKNPAYVGEAFGNCTHSGAGKKTEVAFDASHAQALPANGVSRRSVSPPWCPQ